MDRKKCLRHLASCRYRRPPSFPGDDMPLRDRRQRTMGGLSTSGFSDRVVGATKSSDVTSGEYVVMTGSDKKVSRYDVSESEVNYVEMNAPNDFRNRKVEIEGKAILRLAIYVNSGMLTVHLREARYLRSSDGVPCNAYIKVSLDPDDTKKTRCCTDVIKQTNNPVFEEKFSFELLPEDLRKRVFISMWSIKSNESQPEPLGGMSFGVWHIYTNKKKVDGSYFLLHNDVARRKHVQASTEELLRTTAEAGLSEKDDYATIEVRGQDNATGDTTQATAVVPTSSRSLVTSTPRRSLRPVRVYSSELCSLGSPKRQSFLSKRFCNDWEFVCDLSARGASELEESGGARGNEKRFVDDVTDLSSTEHSHRGQRSPRTRSGRCSQLSDSAEQITSAKAVGRAIRQCIRDALRSREKCLLDLSSIANLDEDNPRSVRLKSTLSSPQSDGHSTITWKTRALTSSRVGGKEIVETGESLLRASSALTDQTRTCSCEASEESYIHAVSRACRAFLSKPVDGLPTVRGPSTPGRTDAVRPSRRPARGSGTRQSRDADRRDYVNVNVAVGEPRFGEKRKCRLVLGDEAESSSVDVDVDVDWPAPTKRRKFADLSFSSAGRSRTEPEMSIEEANGRRASWRTSFRRVFGARGSGSRADGAHSLPGAPEETTAGKFQQNKLRLIDRMRGLTLGIRDSFSSLRKRHK